MKSPNSHVISLPEQLNKTLHLPFCCTQEITVTRADLLAHALALSSQLPEQCYAINLCQDRYLFIVAYLAVCIRQQISLLPANQAPKTCQILKNNYKQSYILSDHQATADFYINYAMLEKSYASFPHIDIDRPLSISFTSGSTGESKAVLKTWREFQASADLALQRFNLQDQAVTLLSTAPMQHMYGLETSLFWVLFSRMTLHHSRPFYPEDIRNTLQRISGDKILICTPRHLKSCTHMHSNWGDIKFILSSTAPMDTLLAEQIEENMQAPLFELFGSTETLSFATRRPTQCRLWQPYQGISLLQQEGQSYLQGGHINDKRVLDDDFQLHEQGLFSLTGRSSDLIKIAGKRASLNELNQLLNQIIGVEDGVFFASKNERLSALVVSQLPKQSIKQQLKKAIDDVFLPRAIYTVPQLPRNDMGKLIKTDLEQMIQAYQLVRK